MTFRRSTAVVRGLASFVAAALLVVGVPVALAAFVGWPLPTSLPDSEALSRALRTGISDEVVVNTLAVIAWLAWGQLVLGLVAEVVGVVRGREPPRLPVLPAMQGLAGRLVAGVLLVGAPLHPARAMALPTAEAVVLDAEPPPAGLVGERLAAARPAPAESAAPATASRATTGTTVIVERHDSYWAVAERTLGDGLRWREIHELNVGRTMDDGHVIAAGEDTLRAGWRLALPNGATANDADSPRDVGVEAGDNFWSLAEEQLAADLGRQPTDEEVAPYWHEVVVAKDDRLVEPGNPDLVVPGQVVVLPPARAITRSRATGRAIGGTRRPCLLGPANRAVADGAPYVDNHGDVDHVDDRSARGCRDHVDRQPSVVTDRRGRPGGDHRADSSRWQRRR